MLNAGGVLFVCVYWHLGVEQDVAGICRCEETGFVREGFSPAEAQEFYSSERESNGVEYLGTGENSLASVA